MTFKQASLQRDEKCDFRSIAVKVRLKVELDDLRPVAVLQLRFSLDAVRTIHNKYNGNWLLALKLAPLR